MYEVDAVVVRHVYAPVRQFELSRARYMTYFVAPLIGLHESCGFDPDNEPVTTGAASI